MNTEKILREIEGKIGYLGQIVYVKDIPARKANYGKLAKPLHPKVQSFLESIGISDLYVHQVEAIDAIREGKNVVIATSTASGKSLCYFIPVIESIISDGEARALLIYPTKALAQDQLKKLTSFKEIDANLNFELGTYDGDTPTSTRKRLRDRGNIILSNPDMLHVNILPNHASWSDFFANLKFVVIDEIHAYRGIFGSNVAHVMKRLNRICRHYGSHPQFICCSATISNPKELAEKLTDHEMVLIDRDTSPKGPKKFILWNPPFIDAGRTERRSPYSEAKDLMVYFVKNGNQTIVFVQARILAELLYRYCQDELQRTKPSLSNSIRAYRSGYLPELRRDIERKLFSGELLGVISTSALELGIDVGELDVCIMVGYPGTIASTWQRAGRAGRGDEEAIIILIARNDPIDQYLMRKPEYFFGKPVENVVISVDNPYIMLGHLRCAAHELPISVDEEKTFGESAPAVLDLLQESQHVTFSKGKWYWIGTGYPSADFGLRNISENSYSIVDVADNRVIGMLDEFSAFMLVHDQAIYMQEAETYLVKELNITQKVAYVEKVNVDYYTQAITEVKIRVAQKENEKQVHQCTACFGRVVVTSTTIMFRKIKLYTSESIGFGNLDLPHKELHTSALWLIPSISAIKRVKEFGRVPGEGLMGIGNALAGVIPIFIICDSVDIGPVVDSSGTDLPSVFIYDKYPEGLGFAEKSYELIEQILESCLELIESCPCEDGCPSCVGSALQTWSYFDADSGTRERIPDKEAALILLHDMLGKEPYVPKKRLGTVFPSETPIEEQGKEVKREVKPLPGDVENRLRRRLQSMNRSKKQ